MNYFNFLFVVLFILSFLFIFMALYVFMCKKPLIIKSVWMTILFALCFLPQIITSVILFIEDPDFSYILLSLLFIGMIVWVTFMMKGYIIYGVDGKDFQLKLIETLQNNKYEFEENLSFIKIKNPEVEFNISMQSWVGTVQIRSKSMAGQEILKEIMHDLKNQEIKTNILFPIISLIGGIIIMISTISMFIDF
ncbi:MAG: hypothetical protein BWY27_00173 [Bacteroidetes bacterium ADurb.Bin234]|nr:MAG: hypothetical protein BWY27_00173 [Bacteroidetes bacterium ADurb.Bin234]